MDDKLYRQYHRNYANIEELYDDISRAVTNAKLRNDEIVISYRGDTLTIKDCRYCYRTYLNGKEEPFEVEDQDVYFHLLEFAHDNRCDVSELTFSDTCLRSADKGGLDYTDTFGRSHRIDFSACAERRAKEDKRSQRCIATRNIIGHYFLFNTGGVKIKIVFHLPITLKRCGRLLYGKRTNRFNKLRKLIEECGYSTYDIT